MYVLLLPIVKTCKLLFILTPCIYYDCMRLELRTSGSLSCVSSAVLSRCEFDTVSRCLGDISFVCYIELVLVLYFISSK